MTNLTNQKPICLHPCLSTKTSHLSRNLTIRNAHVCLLNLRHIADCCCLLLVWLFSTHIYSRMEAASSKSSEESTTPSAKDFTINETPVCLLVLGMAGSGKTEFVKKLTQYNYDSLKPYTINLDPACKETPYPTNIGKI